MPSDKSPKKPRKANGHGGRRAGAGRKTPEAKRARADFNAATRETLAAWLPDLLRNLKRLADGGYERVEHKFERQMVVPPPDTVDPEGNPVSPYEDLVLVERKVETAEPDRAANEYLVNRLLGKPMQAVQHSGPQGGPVPVSVVLEAAAAKLYGATPPHDPD